MSESEEGSVAGKEPESRYAVRGQRLDKYRKDFPGGKVPVDKAIELILVIARHLEATQPEKDPNLVMKPSNIMVLTDSKVKFRDLRLDPGDKDSPAELARVATDKRTDRLYMAPEQLEGKIPDKRADVWSLGAVFYELINGIRDFAGEDSESVIRETIDDAVETWGFLNHIQKEALFKALAASKEERFSTTMEFARALESTKKKDISRRKAVAIGTVIAVVCITACIFIIRYFIDMQTLIVPDEYVTIQKAMEAARAGNTVLVKAGVYEGPIVFQEGIRLIGDGMDKVTIRCKSKQGSVIRVVDCDSGSIEGMTLEHISSIAEKQPGPVLLLKGSSVKVAFCRIQDSSGDGILIRGGGKAIIDGCVIQSNNFVGIALKEGANPVLRNNTFRANVEYGIYISDASSGTIEGNVVEKNGDNGIGVFDDGTAPMLKNNKCFENGIHGIYFGKGADGLVEENVCEKNELSGIAIFEEDTEPLIKGNQCRANGTYGIYLGQGSDAVAEGNVCEKNISHGIAVCNEDTEPKIMNNKCLENEEDGIFIGEGAHGIFEENVCENNRGSGIRIVDAGSKPILRKNKCIGNGKWGIDFSGGAKPEIESSNIAEENVEGQIKK